MTGETIAVHPHKVNGSGQLSGGAVLDYLTADGYEAEASALMTTAARFPGGYQYTADRHRYLVFIMPGGYWLAGDCTESEERIKRLGRERRARI